MSTTHKCLLGEFSINRSSSYPGNLPIKVKLIFFLKVDLRSLKKVNIVSEGLKT